jgi:putative transposase
MGLYHNLSATITKMTSDLRRERNSVSNLKAHLVFVTKNRRHVLTSEGLAVLEKSFSDVAKKMNFQVIEFNGESDHVHLLIEFPPKLSISQIVNALKGVSSRRYGQANLPKPYGKDSLWSPSYFASTVGGATIEILKLYIQNQLKPS